MTKETENELRQKLTDLNAILLEAKDQVNALAAERDKYKGIAEYLWKKICENTGVESQIPMDLIFNLEKR